MRTKKIEVKSYANSQGDTQSYANALTPYTSYADSSNSLQFGGGGLICGPPYRIATSENFNTY
jgi:hypothetical protein